MSTVSNNTSCVAGLANLGVAAAFGALLVNMEQTCAALIAEAERQEKIVVKETVSDEEIEEVVEVETRSNQNTLLYVGRVLALICLFGIFFMMITGSLVSKNRIYPMKSFTYLLTGLASLAFAFQMYILRNSSTKQTMRFNLAVIYMIFLVISFFVMTKY